MQEIVSLEKAELVLDARAQLGEGALWDSGAQLLWWVDIDGQRLHAYDPAAGVDRDWDIGQKVGTVVNRVRGGLMLAVANGFAAFDPASGRLATLVDPEAGLADNRFNDGKCDPAGRFWAGTMSMRGQGGSGTLWRLDADLNVSAMITGVSTSNGLVWSSDQRTFYYIDTPTQQVVAYDYDAHSGAIGRRRVVIQVPGTEGWPDGMAIDAEDKLWIAHWGGGQVVCWDPVSGAPMARIRVDAPHTTACAFGGPNLDTLYITSARVGLGEDALRQYPHSGGVFVARPGVCGVPAFAFAG